MISRSSKILLGIGLIPAMIWSTVMAKAASDHNPQMEYTLNPEGLIWIFLSWFAVIFSPFILTMIILEVFGRLKRKMQR